MIPKEYNGWKITVKKKKAPFVEHAQSYTPVMTQLSIHPKTLEIVDGNIQIDILTSKIFEEFPNYMKFVFEHEVRESKHLVKLLKKGEKFISMEEQRKIQRKAHDLTYKEDLKYLKSLPKDIRKEIITVYLTTSLLIWDNIPDGITELMDDGVSAKIIDKYYEVLKKEGMVWEGAYAELIRRRMGK